ncbi:hypothetical protein AB1Y20_015622 [Prymnesium parvum]|uniref:Magnesium transporter n=1 Tax=Prymnesium parvum TaxID=97485 RepID=A0AB34K1H5_PRYPA
MAELQAACNASKRVHHVLPSGLELTCVDRCGVVSSENMSHENLIGLGIAIGANAVIPLALNLQKLAHTQNKDSEGNPRKPMTQLPLWWLGLFLMISGEFFNLLAYGYAPTSLVAPVGAVGVFFNGIIATLGMKEPFGVRDALGLLAIAGGVVMVVSAVPEVQMDLNKEVLWNQVLPDWRVRGYFIFVASFTAIWIVAVVPRYKHRFVLCYLTLCAVIASVTVVASRAFSSILTEALASGQFSEFESPIPYVAALLIGVTAVWSTTYLNKAMMHFGNNEVVPVYYCTFTLASVSAGALVYSEFYCLSVETTILFAFGCGITFFGVFCVASGKHPAEKRATGTTFRRMMDDPAASVAPSDVRPSVDNGRDNYDAAAERAHEAATPPSRDGGGGGRKGGGKEDSTIVDSLNKAGAAQILRTVLSESRLCSGTAYGKGGKPSTEPSPNSSASSSSRPSASNSASHPTNGGTAKRETELSAIGRSTNEAQIAAPDGEDASDEAGALELENRFSYKPTSDSAVHRGRTHPIASASDDTVEGEHV